MSLSAKQCDFWYKVPRLLLKAQELGFGVKVVQFLRTVEQEQAEIDAGKSWLSNPSNSRHVQGLAIDIALFKDGAYIASDPGYEALGQFWESLGGVWGGRWKTPDSDHYEVAP